MVVVLLCEVLFAAAARPTHTVRPWQEYQTILWIGESASKHMEQPELLLRRLREMGINTGMVYGDANPRVWADAKFAYYVENVVNRGLCLKFNSKVTDWDEFVTEWAKNGRPEERLVRDYCLDDPEWRSWARQQMKRVAAKNAAYGPLAYDIRDELSTTISANPFDYDFSPIALEAFRAWLKTRYPDLEALNRQWETAFKEWSEVVPFTTDRIKNRMATGNALPNGKPDWSTVASLQFNWPEARKNRTAWNFAPWADFRTYMDVSLAQTLDDLRETAQAVDPKTPVGVEGTQMPHAFGGYDLWRLSQVLDWVEPYDIGNAREIFGSFMPGKTLLTTVFENETRTANRRLWHLLLEGDRGCIIWWSEDCIDWKAADLPLTAKGRALAPVLAELTSPLGALFLQAKRVNDPVFLHYSQASIQANWLIESTPDGPTWLRRFSSFEANHNLQVRVRNSWLKLLQDLGYTPTFVSTEQIEGGYLTEKTNAVLALPSSWAVSDEEAEAMARLVRNGGTLLWNGTPGVFDGRAGLRAESPLEKLAPKVFTNVNACAAVTRGPAEVNQFDLGSYSSLRLSGAATGMTSWVRKQIGFAPEVAVDPRLSVRTHRFQLGTVQLLAFERNISYQMSEELRQAGGNEPLEKPVQVEAKLRKPQNVYDLRRERLVGRTDKLSFTLDPWQPSLFAISPEELPETGLVKHLLKAQRP